MFTTDYSCHLMKKKHANWMGFFIAMAITGAVCIGVTLYFGDNGPREIEGLMPYFWIWTATFTALSIWIYATKRFLLIITGKKDQLKVEINDPYLGTPLVFSTPFRLSCQWTEQYMGKGAKLKLLYVTLVSPKNEPLVTFESSLGAAHTVPSKFDYVDLMDEQDRKRFIVSEHSYSIGKARDVASEIYAYLAYLERTKAKGNSPAV
ncbi:MAG: hypothetical protein K0S12_492 [Bacteroidetes bacterium]|nr:hypothetical protein [Bacteroidota bacterium]